MSHSLILTLITFFVGELQWSQCLVDFKFLGRKEDQQDGQYSLKQLTTIAEIPFFDVETDCIVLELETDDRSLPPPLEYFFLVPDVQFHLIHQRMEAGGVKATDNVEFIIDPSKHLESIEYIINISKEIFKQSGKECLISECIRDNEQSSMQNKDRWLLNCQSRKGASGAPGVAVVDEKPVVLTMLLHGYPNWYYNEKCQNLIQPWHEQLLVQQGTNFRSVAEKMKQRNNELHGEIFKPFLR